jgi:hypothetical protein
VKVLAKPPAVVIIAWFLFAATAIAVVVGCAILFPGELLQWMAQFNKPGMAVFRAMGRPAGTMLLTLAAMTLVAAIGLLRGRKWAWWMAAALFTINGVGDVVSFFITRDALRSASGILICAAFLYTLSRDRVRRYFN